MIISTSTPSVAALPAPVAKVIKAAADTNTFLKTLPTKFGADGLAVNASFEMECIAKIPTNH